VRILTLSAALALVVTFAARAGDTPSAPSLSDLPDFYSDARAYRADPFIRAAVELQSIGRTAALNALRTMARKENAARISVLCRMLFVPRAGATLRPPAIGGPLFLDGTTRAGAADPLTWPLEPIELVDGVPFLVVQGYMLFGVSESAESYMQYCEESGEWSDVRYSLKTEKQKADALQKLLASAKWRAPLGASERAFLRGQIQ
jgi:hypothetical protein